MRIALSIFVSLSGLALQGCSLQLIGGPSRSPGPSVSTITLSDGRLEISGSGLSSVSAISISGPGVSSSLQILSQGDTSLAAAAASSQIKLALGAAYNLLITSAAAADPTTVLFQVQDGSIGPNQLDRSYVVKTGDTMTGTLNLPINGLAVGTSQLIVSGGGVGIGTTSPNTVLHANSSVENIATFSTSFNDSTITVGGNIPGRTGEQYITYQNGDTSSNGWLVGMGDDESFHFDYSAAGELIESTSRLTITQGGNLIIRDGNLGIASTAPTESLEIGHVDEPTSTATQSFSEKIALTGSFWNGAAPVHHSFKLQNIASTTVNEEGRLAVLWDASELMSIKSNGYVGIGTTSPTTKLSVSGGDIHTVTAGNGLILKSPDGLTCRRVSIDNTGSLVTSPVACP